MDVWQTYLWLTLLKNQLVLLEAARESDLPRVLALAERIDERIAGTENVIKTLEA